MEKSKNEEYIVIDICGLSGSGKSTLIRGLKDLASDDYHVVTSYTTRKVRVHDKNDKYTHVFVSESFWKVSKKKSLATYTSPDGSYHSWTDITSFRKDKINLYAIDPEGHNKFIENIKKKNLNIKVLNVYLEINEKEQMKRLKLRGEKDTSLFLNEEHLKIEKIDDRENTIRFNVMSRNIDELVFNLDKIIKEKLKKGE